MIANKKSWQKSKYLDKRVAGEKSEKKFFIFCEGEKTEPNYFDSFKLSKASVITYGEGKNTISLVKWVESEVSELKSKRKYDPVEDEIWCVFDRDSFNASNFDNAITMAGRKGYNVAYSNEAFELWYILHFDYLNTELNRDQYIEILNKRFKKEFGHKYEKNLINTYDELLSSQDNAIKFAKKLLKEINNGCPHKNKPTTTVHLLVEKLNEYIKE